MSKLSPTLLALAMALAFATVLVSAGKRGCAMTMSARRAATTMSAATAAPKERWLTPIAGQNLTEGARWFSSAVAKVAMGLAP